MKQFLRVIPIFAMTAILAGLLQAETFKIDRGHSHVGFTIRHIFAQVSGRFTDFSGTVEYDPQNVEKLAVDVVVQAKSINTDNEGRDRDLRSPNFFNADSFPTLKFKSTKAYKTDAGVFLEGKLTIKDSTKDITIAVEILGVGGSGDHMVAGFHSTFKINRKDYGIVWNRKLDMGGMLLGDEVTVSVDIEANNRQ